MMEPKLNFIQKIKKNVRQSLRTHLRLTRERRQSNQWLRHHCAEIKGGVLSIGSEYDRDGEGGFYRNYFKGASSYTTSEVSDEFGTDLVIDVRSMPEIESESFDGIYCSGVLEHVDDFHSGIQEITRILKSNGILLLGLPFRQAIHMEPNDYWQFTEYGIRHLLKDHYTLLECSSINQTRRANFPASYWVKAQKN
mgnify:CR=1 FL=1